MKRLIVLSTVALLTACSSVKPRLPDEVVINGVSKHFFEDGKNGQNYGAGVRYGKVRQGWRGRIP